MKVNKFAAVFMAAVMAGSVALVAGCMPDDKDPANNGGEDKTAAQKVIEALVQPDYLGFEITVDTAYGDKNYVSSSAESKGDLVSEFTSDDMMAYAGKLNVKSGDGDITIHQTSKTKSDDDGDGEWDEEYSETNWSYGFLRDSFMFSHISDEETEITDFSNIPLHYDGELSLDMFMDGEAPVWIDYLLNGLGLNSDSIFNMATDGLYDLNYLFVSLADAANAVSESENKVTLDLNKFAYQLIEDVKAVLNSVNDQTTVSILYQNELVKKWVKAFTSFIDFKEVAKIIETELQPLLQDKDYTLPAAEQGDDVYSYVLKLLNDTAFATKVLGIPTAIGALSIEGVFDMVCENFFAEVEFDLDTVKGYIDQYFQNTTATTLAVNMYENEEEDYNGYGRFTMSGAKFVYTLSDNKLSKLEAVGEEFVMNFGDTSHYEDYHTSESVVKASCNVTIDFPATAYTLKNIDNCTVREEGYVTETKTLKMPNRSACEEIIDWIKDNDNGYFDIREVIEQLPEQLIIELEFELTAQHGIPTGLVIKDKSGNSADLGVVAGEKTITLGEETYLVALDDYHSGSLYVWVGYEDMEMPDGGTPYVIFYGFQDIFAGETVKEHIEQVLALKQK